MASSQGASPHELGQTNRAVKVGFFLTRHLTRKHATRVEGSHRQLSARFSDRLCCDNADCFPDVYQVRVCQTPAIALLTDRSCRLTGEGRSSDHLFNLCSANSSSIFVIDCLIALNQHFTRFRINHIGGSNSTQKTVFEGDEDAIAVHHWQDHDAFLSSAIEFSHDHVLRHVH